MKGWLRADHSDIHTCVRRRTHIRSAPAQLLYTKRLQSKYASAAGAFSECVRAFTLCCICAAVHSPLWCTRRDDLIAELLRRTRGPMCGILQADYAASVNKTNYYYGNLIRSVLFFLGKWSLRTAHWGKSTRGHFVCRQSARPLSLSIWSCLFWFYDQLTQWYII